MESNIPDLSSLEVSHDATPEYTIAEDTFAADSDLPVDLDLAFEANEQPQVPQLSEEDADKLFELRMILTFYYKSFEKELAMLAEEFTQLSLAQKNIEQLESLRKKADMILGCASGVQSKAKMFNACIFAIEKFSTHFGYNITGTTNVLLNDPDFQIDIKRLAIKWLTSGETRPEVTCAMKLLSTMAQQCYANEQAGEQVEAPQAPTPQIAASSTLALDKINIKFQEL